MTLEDALGRPIENIRDAVRAQAGFDYAKHGCPNKMNWDDATDQRINEMSNVEFLTYLWWGFDALQEASK